MVDLAQTPGYARPAGATPRDAIVGYDELGREIRQTSRGVQYAATDVAPVATGGAGGRGSVYNLLDNIIGFDDGVMTPGENLGAGARDFVSGLLSDPLGTGADIVRGGYETIAAGMAPGATPMDAMGAAGIPMGVGGIFARPAGSVGMGGRVAGEDYRGVHRAPGRTDDGSTASIDNLTTIYPDDIYDVRVAPRYYGHMADPVADREMIEMFARLRGRPDVGVPVYRAVPVDAPDDLNPGDWVTPSRQYAEDHGESALGGEYRIIEGNVPARELYTDANSIFEFGWSPDLSANRSTATGLLAASAADTPAQRVARLLREGRADEVTDDLMAQADPQEMYQLYVSGETGMDLPMDEASRMARAQEMGRVDDQFHATLDDFPAFMPSETGLTGRGVYTGDDAGDVLDYARSRGSSTEGLNAIPLLAPESSTYARRIDWQNTLDADPDLPYNATWEQNVEGMRRAAETMSGQGFPGVHSQPGERVTFNPQSLRSRFARFDPRLSHLSNLNAANADPITGLLATQAGGEQDPLANLRDYVSRYSLLAQ